MHRYCSAADAAKPVGIHKCMCGGSGEVDPATVKIFHFTACQKPWVCQPWGSTVCEAMQKKWWEMRGELEKKAGLPVTGDCAANGNKYEPLSWE